jgi:hypothetical protein
MTDEGQTQQQLAVQIVDAASAEQRLALRQWALHMLDIRASDAPKMKKVKSAIAVTIASNLIWPAMKMAAKKVKQVGWDDRSRTARLGLGGAAAGIALFGGANAGIAALGTAIGVPLWVVLGAGASFANVLIEEIARRGDKPFDDGTGR